MDVNKAQLADIFGVSERTLTTWQKNGLPIKAEGKRGQSHIYDTAEVHAWIVARELGKLTVGNDGEVLDLDAERARLTKHQADLAELKLERERGAVVEINAVTKVVGEEYARCRTRLLAIPAKLAPLLESAGGMPEKRSLLDEAITDALMELVADGSADFDATESAADSPPAEPQAAAKVDGQPVG